MQKPSMNHHRKFEKLRQWTPGPGHWKKPADALSSAAVLLVAAFIPASVVHADFENGLRAFESGYFDKARSEWSKSATAGDAPSQFQLGMLFDKGTGVRENNTQAHFWYALASIGGIEDATAALSEIEQEMTADEIQQAKELTDRFVGVFAPIRYITVEPDNTGDAITEDTPEVVVQEEAQNTEPPVSSTDQVIADAPAETQLAPETDSTVVESTPSESEPVVTESEAESLENTESVSQPDTTQTPSTEVSDVAIDNEDAETLTTTDTVEEISESRPLAESAPDAEPTADAETKDSQISSDETVETAVAIEAVESESDEQNTGESEVATSDSPETEDSGSESGEQSITESPTQISAVEPADRSDSKDEQSSAEPADDDNTEINEADVEPIAKNSPVESRGVLPSNTSNSLDPNSQLRAKMRTLIREVQTMLNDLGYPVGTADGVIGRRTREAVANFQRDNGLPNSGELGPQTIRALRAKS